LVLNQLPERAEQQGVFQATQLGEEFEREGTPRDRGDRRDAARDAIQALQASSHRLVDAQGDGGVHRGLPAQGAQGPISALVGQVVEQFLDEEGIPFGASVYRRDRRRRHGCSHGRDNHPRNVVARQRGEIYFRGKPVALQRCAPVIEQLTGLI
jgi:hypothetical protein